jgi:serine/threonine-protein kinase
MDWVQGQPLRRILSSPGNVQGKLPPERAIRIALGICDALEYIHGQGVVHRDLKPENIMVDAGDRITLMDFGLASLNGARRVTFGKLSQIVGTVDYISPEQVSGIRGDARSDLYALGVMLYEMLAGATPFPGDNPFVIMNHRLIGDPVPPREMNPEISAELQEILYRALERDPRHRYASAREFAWDLRHPQRVGAADRPELRNRQRPALRTKTPLRYGAFILISLIAMALLYIARHT